VKAEQLSPEIDSAPQKGRSYIISLAQIAPFLGDRGRNLDLHLARIAEARSAGADLVVFPELSLTGYFLRDMVADVAMPADSLEIERLLCTSGDMSVVLGFAEQSPQQRFYNAALFAAGQTVLHVHRKVYLPTYGLFDEQRYFAAGERIQAFDTTRFGRVGLLICEDFWHLSALAILQAEDVDLVLCIANSPARGVAGETVSTSQSYRRMAATYAELLGSLVVLVNRVGFEDGLCFWGGSLVAGPDGNILAEGPSFDEALITVEFDPGELRRRRLKVPLARDERLLLTIEELQRIKRRRYAE
jgi:predicted amidohydrolase